MKFRRNFEWLQRYASGWQFGEEGVIDALASKFVGKTGSFCEFGAGTNCSCAALIRKKWHGTIFESDRGLVEALTPILMDTETRIAHRRVSITGDASLANLLDRTPDVLVIDVDSIDYHIFAALEMTPQIVMIEHHDEGDLERSKYPDVPSFEECGKDVRGERDAKFAFRLQATAKAIKALGESKGYALVAWSRVNSIFLRKDLMPKSAPIVGVMSLPQLGHNTTWGCICDAFAACGLPAPHRYDTPAGWWERGLQNILSHLIEDGAQIAVCMDYDSVFEPKDLFWLLKTMQERPDIDALTGIEPRRINGEILLSMKEQFDLAPNEPMKKDLDCSKPIQVKTAHFGLTAIRLAKLAAIPKPWFLNVPGDNGEWEVGTPGMCDADIYFWRKFEAAGLKACVLPGIRIGHLEPLIAMIDNDGVTRHRYYHQWLNGTRESVVVDKPA